MPSTLCRDCTEVTVGPNTKACPACGSARLISHEELTTLSIAHVDCDAFFAAVEKRAKEMPKGSIILANLCGRGDKDIFTVAERLGVEM